MIKANEDLSRTESVSNIAAILRLVTLYGNNRIISMRKLLPRVCRGIMNNLSYPYPLYNGHLPKENPVRFYRNRSGGNVHFGIGPGSMARYDIEFKYKTHCVDEKDAELLFAKPFLPAERTIFW